MSTSSALGWAQFAAGIAAVFTQVWMTVHGVPFDVTHATVATGVAAGGYATARQGVTIGK